MRFFIRAVAVIIALAAVDAAAYAAGRCAPRDKIVKVLASKFGEKPSAGGIVDSGRGIVELFVSDKQTWTVLLTNRSGVSCILAAGDGWDRNAPMPVAGAPL